MITFLILNIYNEMNKSNLFYICINISVMVNYTIH